MPDDNTEQIWEYLDELRKALFTISKLLGQRSKDQKELRALFDLNAHLVQLNWLMGRRHRPDPRGRVRKVIRDENGKISGLEDMEWSNE